MRDAGRDGVRPGVPQEGEEARIVDGGDGVLAVLGGPEDLEPAVGLQGVADDLRALRDLAGRDLDAHLGLDRISWPRWAGE